MHLKRIAVHFNCAYDEIRESSIIFQKIGMKEDAEEAVFKLTIKEVNKHLDNQDREMVFSDSWLYY